MIEAPCCSWRRPTGATFSQRKGHMPWLTVRERKRRAHPEGDRSAPLLLRRQQLSEIETQPERRPDRIWQTPAVRPAEGSWRGPRSDRLPPARNLDRCRWKATTGAPRLVELRAKRFRNLSLPWLANMEPSQWQARSTCTWYPFDRHGGLPCRSGNSWRRCCPRREPRIPVLPVQIEDIQTLLKRSGDSRLSR